MALYIFLANYFHCTLNISLDMFSKKYLPERTLTQRFIKLVILMDVFDFLEPFDVFE